GRLDAGACGLSTRAAVASGIACDAVQSGRPERELGLGTGGDRLLSRGDDTSGGYGRRQPRDLRVQLRAVPYGPQWRRGDPSCRNRGQGTELRRGVARSAVCALRTLSTAKAAPVRARLARRRPQR